MPATQTVTVPEVTYDQIQAHATRTIVSLEARLAELHLEQWKNMAESVAGALRTGSTVGTLADMMDETEQEMKIVRQRLETTRALKDTLRREHGGINDAVHDSPVPAAQPEFYD